MTKRPSAPTSKQPSERLGERLGRGLSARFAQRPGLRTGLAVVALCTAASGGAVVAGAAAATPRPATTGSAEGAAIVSAAVAERPTFTEPYRPTFHFTPAVNWMNDPNGLVYYKGEYHLFFQHNPNDDNWGDISWGHAVSTDLVHWKQLPLAIPFDDDEYVWSGSVVVDKQNTSGLGTKANPAMVAVYTSWTLEDYDQQQALAYSLDRGRTWTKYAGNPVLDIADSDFRDPKVQWHAPTKSWLMTAVKAKQHKVAFYSSKDLKHWTHLSDFGPQGVSGGAWECPDLFPMRVDGDGPRKWVLVVSVNPGAVAGGSGTQYFVGDFDGTTFTSDDGRAVPGSSLRDRTHWLDFGKDYYAAVSWNGTPEGRRYMIGWMSNWQYAGDVPTSPWRSAMSVPRRMSLVRVGDDLRLAQRPVQSLASLHSDKLVDLRGVTVDNGSTAVPEGRGSALDIRARFHVRDAEGQAQRFGLVLRRNAEQRTVVGYDTATGTVYVDRRRSGRDDFSDDFAAGVQRAPLAAHGGVVRLRILIDESSVEVFAGGGRAVITDQVFPDADAQGLRVFASGGQARLARLAVWRMGSYRD